MYTVYLIRKNILKNYKKIIDDIIDGMATFTHIMLKTKFLAHIK